MVEDSKRTAAYVPWATFKNALDELAKGMPSRIDRSVFPGIAWTVQNQLFIGMRFMGLLKGDNEATPLLHELVTGADEDRKVKLGKVVRDAYADLIAIDLTKATRNQFEEKLGELYNVSGDTRVKAVRFFLSAAEYVGISLSTFIVPKKGKTGRARRPKQAISRPRPPKPPVIPPPNTPPPPSDTANGGGASKSVSLVSGGTLTLSATLDLFSLNPDDRKFVFDLIDKLEEYAAVRKVSS